MTIYDGATPSDRKLAPTGTPNVNRLGCVYVWDDETHSIKEIGRGTTLDAAKAIVRLWSGKDDFVYYHTSSFICAAIPAVPTPLERLNCERCGGCGQAWFSDLGCPACHGTGKVGGEWSEEER